MQVLHFLVLYTMKDYKKNTNFASLVIHSEDLYFDASIIKKSLFLI
jgi:hypothetical protein